MVMREALLLVAVGLGLGAVLATIASSAAKAMLFGLTPTDPLALVAAAVLLATTGAAATIIPALKAGRLQPTSALRED
jgi:ABC-type antimicrobial peptide transport system permease subunit